jgi:hypothetical protein
MPPVERRRSAERHPKLPEAIRRFAQNRRN